MNIKIVFKLSMLLLFVMFSFSAAQVSYVENEGVDCSVTISGNGAGSNNSNLPDLFMKMDGQRMTTKEEWVCRRQEIRKQLEKTVYGEMRVTPFEATTGTVSRTSISGTVSDNDKSVNISATVSIPSGCALPVPAVFSYGGVGNGDVLINNCVATINFPIANAGAERSPRSAKTGYYYTLYGGSSNIGVLAAQAWAISRFIDIIQKSDGSILKWDALGVTGCSRNGKSAFAAGVFDQRMALTYPIESGTGGVPVLREGGEPNTGPSNQAGKQSPSNAYGEAAWFGDVFATFQNSVNTLPTDMHGAVAMVAPRGLLILDNPYINNLGPRAAHLSATAGGEVYKALGYGGNITYLANGANGTHCSWQTAWTSTFDAAVKKFLKPTGNNTGGNPTLTPRSGVTGNTALINWTTPNLSGTYTPKGATPPDGKGSLSVSISPETGGTVTSEPADISGRLELGTDVSLTATPADGYIFTGWSGDAAGTSPSTTVMIEAEAKKVTATFKRDMSNICFDYEDTFCGGLGKEDVKENTTDSPNTGECVFIKDFTQIEAQLGTTNGTGSVVSINGEDFACMRTNATDAQDDWDNCPVGSEPGAKPKPAKVDGGYYVYMKSGTLNSHQDNGWRAVEAGERTSKSCDGTPIQAKTKPVANFSISVIGKNLHINTNAATVVDIFDLRGNKATSLNVSGSQTIELSLPSGVYFAKTAGNPSVKFMLK